MNKLKLNRRRIAAKFAELKNRKEKALVTFVTAGDPDLEFTARLLPRLALAGADIIELGMPFSDPMADGPTIQRASERALTSGTTVTGLLEMLRSVRDQVPVPIVMMGYSNPVHSYGWQRFAKDAVAAGLDGLLLVDLPPEEAEELRTAARAAGLDLVMLLAPTSDEARISKVNRSGSGFIYYVTVTGVTGIRQSVSSSLDMELTNLCSQVRLPVVAGFGISTQEQTRQVAGLADGVVVGSAIMKLFEQYQGEELLEQVENLVSSLKAATRIK